ncbi:phage portal protein [Bifidobacterium pseudolongum subsp. globosum]|uniref:Phage portal protein n=1 Tax=Bifidobacterium pseudolongum subsp. globosum TaxID=1690 RepID=A0A4Q5BE27_9BIFI|nr:phage portal protein [Bifidobacterium pseudolongum]RYQ68406.1 phage portal protein [Bifidobacterium pseudolongum subsp. globosum]
MQQTTATPTLSGAVSIPASIRGMDQDDLDMTRALLKVWRAKYPRNLLRSAFYDAKQRFRNLQISVQSDLGRKIGNTVGWPQKSVRALADKSVFEGFELPNNDEYGITRICMDNELTADVSEAIISCYKHSCSFLTVDYDPYDPSGERILITPRSADWSAAIWDPQRRRIKAALTITGANEHGNITSFNVWLPGRNYAVSSRNGLAGWQAQRQDNRLDCVAVVPFAYDKQMDRPFGRSRINRTLMNLTDMAVRTMVRMEVSAEFYSVPKLWFLGLDKDAFESGTWSSLIADINAISRDVDGEVPDLKQIQQASMSPHGAMLETIAMLASAETDIPPESLGIRVSNPTSAEALAASENALTRVADRQNRIFGQQLMNAMRMAVQLRDNTPTAPTLAGVRPIWAPTRVVSDAARADYYAKVAGVNQAWAQSDVGLAKLGLSMDDIASLRAWEASQRAKQRLDQLRAQTNVQKEPSQDATGSDKTAGDVNEP